jgi:ribokinase
MSSICVLGSINMDEVLRVESLVKSGETIFAKEFQKHAGGKGANQAVAAKRLGAEVYMIGKLGEDSNGEILIKGLREDKVNTKYIFKDKDQATGMAVISVDDQGDNSIIVIPGANMEITKDEILQASELIKKASLIVAQFETPIEITIEAFRIAKENGVTTILNPAPAKEVPNELLKLTDIIIPNETETFEITKIEVNNLEGIKKAAGVFLKKGVKFVIITLGERGAALVSDTNFEIIPAYKVNAIDTTAAGDSFIGAVCSKLQEEDIIEFSSIQKAIKFANKVSSIVVQRQGAQPSLPYLNEILGIGEDEK